MDKRPPTRAELEQVLLFTYVLFALEVGFGITFVLRSVPMVAWAMVFFCFVITAKMHHGAKAQLRDQDEKETSRGEH